jgi:hypothetical protein
VKRYPKALARDYDGNAGRVTEADALIAYLQVLGTLVDFKLYDDKANIAEASMNQTYRALAEFAETWGLAFVGVFLNRAPYALWALASAAVRRGARMPPRED